MDHPATMANRGEVGKRVLVRPAIDPLASIMEYYRMKLSSRDGRWFMKNSLFQFSTPWKSVVTGVLLLLGILAFTGPATAEGGCPDGYYPISLQGATSCAPIPSYGQAQSYQQPYLGPLPSIDRYGVVVFGETPQGEHKGYNSASYMTREDAIDAALEQCQSHGSVGCRVARVMFSTCVSISTDNTGKLYASEAMNCSDDAAIDRDALAQCTAQGGQGCKPFTYVAAWQH